METNEMSQRHGMYIFQHYVHILKQTSWKSQSGKVWLIWAPLDFTPLASEEINTVRTIRTVGAFTNCCIFTIETSLIFSCTISGTHIYFLSVFQNHHRSPRQAFSQRYKQIHSSQNLTSHTQHGSKKPVELPPPDRFDGYIKSWAREENPTASATDSGLPQGKEHHPPWCGASCGFQSCL